MRQLGAIFVLFCLAGCQQPAGESETPLYYQVGVEKKVTTTSPEAQLWFDRGLGLTYGFNHEEAIACFERAFKADPDCAICYWGKAYALGPNYNNVEMTPEASQGAYEAVQLALSKKEKASELERALIEALLTLRPWKLWSPEGDPAAETWEIREVLEDGLERWPDHPALAHLYIHAMEAGPEVADLVPVAENLETLTPGLGHLIHMPSHIYTWTGRYDDVIRVNQRAVEVDMAFVEHAGRENFYTLYRMHNYHFVAYGAMFAGRREVALEASKELVAEIPPALLTEDWIDFVDVFVGTPYHVMVRFGMWDEILADPGPQGDNVLAARAIWRYARGIALASLGRVDEAVEEQEAYLQAVDEMPETRLLFNNPVKQILQVATAVLAGEIEYRRGNLDRAFDHLRQAVVLDEQLNYDEPWGWMEPARHPLGALLTEQGRFDEAVSVYEANLARYPNNGWSLHGLAEGLEARGRKDEAAEVRARYETAWADSDTDIPGSCFCRTKS